MVELKAPDVAFFIMWCGNIQDSIKFYDFC